MDDIPTCMICHNPTLIQKEPGIWVSNGVSVCCAGSNCHQSCLTKYYQTGEIKCLLCRKQYPKINVYTSPKLKFQTDGTAVCPVAGVTNSYNEEPVWEITEETTDYGVTYINNVVSVDNSLHQLHTSEVLLATIDLTGTNEVTMGEIGVALSYNLRIYLIFTNSITGNVDLSILTRKTRRRLWYAIEASITSLGEDAICQQDFWFIPVLREKYGTPSDYMDVLADIHPKITCQVPRVSVSLRSLVITPPPISGSDSGSSGESDPFRLSSEIVIPRNVAEITPIITRPTRQPPEIPIPPRSSITVIPEQQDSNDDGSILPSSNADIIDSDDGSEVEDTPSITGDGPRTMRIIRGNLYYLDSDNLVYLTSNSSHSLGTYDPIIDNITYEPVEDIRQVI